jgi:hypothetical protein
MSLIAVLDPGIWVLNLLPMFLAVVVFALTICFYALLLWLGIGDILLKFAFEDRSFFQMVTECHALNIFEDTEHSLPKTSDLICGLADRGVSEFGGFAKGWFRPPVGKRSPLDPRTSANPGLSDK